MAQNVASVCQPLPEVLDRALAALPSPNISSGQTVFSPELWCQGPGPGGFLNLTAKGDNTRLGRTFGRIWSKPGLVYLSSQDSMVME